MNSNNESLKELKYQEINYFRIIWGWKWAFILIPLIAMITAKYTEQPIPIIYETKASIVISDHGSRKPLSKQSYESIAFLPVVLEKIIDQLLLKKADGASMDQTTLKSQLKTNIPGHPNTPVDPGFLFFIVRNESPNLAKKIADLWVQLVEGETKKIEAFNHSSPKFNKLSPKELSYIDRLENKMINAKESQLRQNIGELESTELKIIKKKSELSTYQKRLKTFSNYKVHIIPKRDINVNIIENRGNHNGGGLPTAASSFIIMRDNPDIKNESSSLTLETTLHPALETLILNRELEIEALESKIQSLNNKVKILKQELFDLTLVYFSGETLERFKNNKPIKSFVSSIASINYAPITKTPVPRKKYTHILLAGILSFGFILFASVLKAHIDAMRQGSKFES